MADPTVLVKFIADLTALAAGAKDVQKQGDQASKGFDWKRVGKFAFAAGAVVAATKGLKDSVQQTTDLAKATAKLERATGMDARTSSAWVETLKTRGISVDSFQTSLTRLSKLMEKYRTTQAKAAQAANDYADASDRLQPIIAKGGDAGKAATKELNKWGNAADSAAKAADRAAAPFRLLGVRLEDVKKGHVQAVLLQAADGLAKIRNPAERAAAAAQLFGRQGAALLPLLTKGSKGIQEQLKLAEKYGATISEKTVKGVAKLADEQRQLKLAQDGVKNSIGQALLPAQVSLYGQLLKVTSAILPFTKNAKVMEGVLIAVGIAMVAYKVATIASTIASLGLNAAMLPTIAIVAGIVLAIGALIVIGYELYKHWDDLAKLAGEVWGTIKDGADSALSWLKANWPYVLGILTGPFGLAAAAIYKNWDAITSAVKNALAGVKSALVGVKDDIAKAAGKVASAIWDGIVGGLAGIGNAAWGVIDNIWQAIQNQAETILGWGTKVGTWIKNAVVGGLVGIGDAAWGVIDNIWAVVQKAAQTIIGWGESIGGWLKRGVIAGFTGVADAITATIRGAINTVLKAWNALKIPGFHVKILGKSVGVGAIDFPNLPLLAQGGIVTSPTLAMIGEAGPEAVLPLGANGSPVQVRVFIGDQELRGMVRTEVRTADNRTAQVLLAGAR